jgi:hypothetical protein
MLKGLWIRLDIPYSEDSGKMRAVLAYSDSSEHEAIKLMELNNCTTIPSAVEEIYQQAIKTGIALDSSLTLVYPHDARHGLAWPAKEAADKRGFKFERQIPDTIKLPFDLVTGYENFDTGSKEDSLSPDEAQQYIMQLNNEGHELYSSGELLEAMGPIRHALWMALRHFGWSLPITTYTIRNLGYILYGTGNNENQAEFIYLTGRMLYLWQLTPPQKEEWEGSEELIGNLAEICTAMDAESVANALKAVKV